MWCLLEHFSMLDSYLKKVVPLSNVMWKPSLSEALRGDSTRPESKPYSPSSSTPSTFSHGMGQPSLSPGAARIQLLSWFLLRLPPPIHSLPSSQSESSKRPVKNHATIDNPQTGDCQRGAWGWEGRCAVTVLWVQGLLWG